MMSNTAISSSLINAVREGRLKRVKVLLSSVGLSYSQGWSEGYVLLCHAIENQHTKIAKYLLIIGAKVNSKNQSCNTPLHLAVRNGYREIVEMLLDRDANIDAKSKNDETPLHLAVTNWKIEITELLLRRGANVEARDGNSMTPLHIAARKGYLQIAEHLFKHGAKVNSVCTLNWREGYTPLHYAAEKGNEEIIKLLLSSGAHVDAKNIDNLTPLGLAVEREHVKVVKLLLDHGANVDAEDLDGKTILYFAAENGYSIIVEHILKYCPAVNNKSNRSSLKAAVDGSGKQYRTIVENLLQYGFTVNPADVDDSKFLYSAVEKGYIRIVEELLKYGSDANILYNSTFTNGSTLLHNATRNKREEIAALLINYGASVNAKDIFKRSSIVFAIENEDFKITKLLLTNGAIVKDDTDLLSTAVKNKCIEIVEILIQHDADINAIDKYGYTALHYTALSPEHFSGEDPVLVQIAKLLLSRGANVDAQTETGETALHIATENGCTRIVEALLEYNADVNSGTTIRNITPLHISAQKENEEISQMLLHKGANVNAKQNKGTTALHIAAGTNHIEVVEVLLKWGAKVNSKDDRDKTPLHIAAGETCPDIIEILLKFDADIDSKDEGGRTPLHIASEDGTDGLVLILLDYGSDINFVSKTNYTPVDYVMSRISSFYNQPVNYDTDNYYYEYDHGSCVIISEILMQHVIKMNTANLYVSEQNRLWISSNDEYNYFRNDCEEETERMKSEKISNNNVSFHDFLTKSTSQIAIYVKNESIVQVLESDDYKTKFPIYASMIDRHFRMGMERKELLQEDNTFFHSFFNTLPYNCTEKIYSYLRNKDLRMLLNACKETTT